MYDHDMLIDTYIAANKVESSISRTDVTLEASSAPNSDSDKVSGCILSVWFYGFRIIKVTDILLLLHVQC